MTQNKVLKGVLLVGIGAASYGMLATVVKMAYADGYTTSEVTISQFVLGILGVLIINAFQKAKNGSEVVKASLNQILQLGLSGTALGLTSVFYYLALKYISVSIAVVLLMQTVWMSVLLEAMLEKKIPSKRKIISVVLVLIGTLLATNVLQSETQLDWRGLVLGLLTAASFSVTMFTANRVATTISSAQRSLYMLMGGTCIAFAFAAATQNTPFHFEIFIKWGIFLSLFGTIIPPILMNAGFPFTGIGLGSIVAALELPVSVVMAYFILDEKVLLIQWIGIGLILFAVFIMNSNFNKNK
ncbi:DMT family transporter [Flavobacterium restrictum]|uniref:EamA family transporter n=1 Tax=Flavobacterium restrictum TaxID=2594428 RepID=A0A553E2N9_9FLAO|nr:DMT family transporter [Flavobacterium restrictum]TRX39288.1 EamA family transporter [Flavobacterium restrictum]